jgi:homoserine dehydrogenase
LRVALLGCGGVGSEVFRLLERQADDLAARIGAPLEVTGVAVRRPGRARSVPVPPELLTTDAMDLVTRPETDIVVEVIGGIEPVRSLLLAAMKNGKSVVSANKALLAEDGATLHQAARENGADLYYEAAVAGAIPLLRPLRESLAGDTVRRVLGIVNGTTNFILDRMDTSGAGFSDALEEDGRGHRQRARPRPCGQAARHLRTARWRRVRPRPPGDDPPRASPRRGAGGLQRGLRGGGVGRPADVLRRRGRRGADGQRGAR